LILYAESSAVLAIPEVALLTFDERIEKNGLALDFQVLPS